MAASRGFALTTRRPARFSPGIARTSATSAPMTYLHGGKQYIVVAVGRRWPRRPSG